MTDSDNPSSSASDIPSAQHSPGRVAGIDYGTVRLGIALSDRHRTLASPLESYQRRNPAADAEHLRRLVAEHEITSFVVGLPVHLDGRESEKSAEARRFGHWLGEVTGLPVVFFDERFTSVEAERMLRGAELTSKRRKRRIDMVAAQLMLAAWLESEQHGSGKPGETAGPGPLDD